MYFHFFKGQINSWALKFLILIGHLLEIIFGCRFGVLVSIYSCRVYAG